MIKFDANSIYDRLLQRMQQNPDWKVVSNNSVVSSLLRSTSEVNAETARYAEYLFKESKWDTAQNPSSILAMARMLGYQPARKISARGTIKVSADPRIHSIGSTLSSSLFDANTNSLNILTSYMWQRPPMGKIVTINSSCTIKDSRGNNYIAFPKSFTDDDFAIDVDIIQGVKKSVEIGIDTIREVSTSSKLDPYLYIPVTIKNCENAGDPLSRSFFKVFLKYNRKNEPLEEYRVTNTLLLSSSSDYDVEVYNDMYNQDLFYLKFNNDISRGKIVDISRNSNLLGIRIEYIESKGAAGNLNDQFDDFTLTNVPAISQTDSTSKSYLKLFGTNYKPIIGGKEAEGIENIRENAPKYYMKNYTAGTKEAYENTISNLKFNLGSDQISPRKVKVYGGFSRKSIKGKEILMPVTYVTFLADHLEDITQSDLEDPYKDIENALNYYLFRLKSPQDTLKFVPPSYVPFAVGISCKVDRDDVTDLTDLTSNIRDIVEKEWGSVSEKLDFGRSFYPSSLEALIHSNFKSVITVSTEVEAVTKVMWMSAERIAANSGAENSDAAAADTTATISRTLEAGQKKHTIRAPYKFNPLFLGNKVTKGFRMFKNGASYIMRLDVLYKRPNNLSVSKEFHTSIFIEDLKGITPETTRNHDAFFIKSTQQNYLWNEDLFGKPDSDYDELSRTKVDKLTDSIQLYYRNHLYTDSDYEQLKKQIENGETLTINDYTINPGSIDDYLIYFSPSFSSDAEAPTGGWVELSFEPIYNLLSKFALGDTVLANRLRKCPLNELNCDETATKGFDEFKKILRDYVDIYISMRPIDPELAVPTTNNIEDANSEESGAVLYIDSSDSSIRNTTGDGTQTINLTSSKKIRMISVECNYRE